MAQNKLPNHLRVQLEKIGTAFSKIALLNSNFDMPSITCSSLVFKLKNKKLLLSLSALFFLLSYNTSSIQAQSFIDPAPADVSVDCVEDAPVPVNLTADDGTGTMTTFEVIPFDVPELTDIDPCTGGAVVRTWRISNGPDFIDQTQTITIAADVIGPTIDFAPVNASVSCELAVSTAPNNAMRYDVWLNSLEVAIALNTEDNCPSNAFTIANDGNTPFNEPCATRTITFTATDGCSNSTTYQATYTSVDTISPMLIGVPANDTLTCADTIPAPPMVTVSDNCTPGLTASFSETSTQSADTTLAAHYTYTITRYWSVTDSCSNTTIDSAKILVRDLERPTFTRPNDITISCNEDPNDFSITGMPTNVMDNCSAVTIDNRDQVIDGICEDEYTIQRAWDAFDVNGNLTTEIQIINVADLNPPTFIVPPSITVDCSEADELSITGQPTNVMDDCDPDPDVDFTDDIFPGTCPNEYLIRRSWSVTDRCGQTTILIQEINVEDQQKPVFTALPQNFSVSCAAGEDITALFNTWINDRAQATAEDNCTTDPNDITWQIYNHGTTDAPSLVTHACPVNDDIVISQDVDFIIIDECGLSDTVTASFSVIDQIPPSISDCPDDLSVSTDPALCSAAVTLAPPVITDACSNQSSMINASDMATLTSQALPGQEGDIAVDPVDLNLLLGASLPLNANTTGTLSIHLDNTDAESAGEFFYIYGEDGTLLGQTNNTDSPCGSSQTDLTLSIAQINSWGADNVISIHLEPNIPDGLPERFAINANCVTPSIVSADLSFGTNVLNGIQFEYSVDGGNRVLVDPVAPINLTLDMGSHLIWYFATDCANNADSCSFTVEVLDTEAPEISCPAPITVSVAPDSCQSTIVLPMPLGATDNCSVLGTYERTLPTTPAEQLLNFSLDPNLNDYLPQSKFLVFDDVMANAQSTVNLIVEMQGDFNTNAAFVNIIGDDGNLLGSTSVGIANCNTPGQFSINIPASTFNTWAADGIVNIEIVPNDITVPPGVLGDGINPCDPMAVNADGDTDGTSFIRARLVYSNLQSSYYATGASPLPLSPFPASGYLAPSFSVGSTEVFYLTEDMAGNPDTCSFTVNVEDTTAPTVLCNPTNLFINPSGLQVEVVNAMDVDAGSFDNCGVIDSFWLTPNIFTCDQIGQVVNVTLNAQDTSGNVGTCQTIVGIAADAPMPTANSGLCGGDTLFLQANPPGPNPGTYLYQWFNPDNVAISPPSSNPDLEIPGIDAADQGPYKVVITGLTGCTAEGVVNVNIEDLPLTPQLVVPSSVCADEDLTLSTPHIPAGTNVQFYWYEGIAPGGTLLGSSTEPMFTVSAPHTTGTHNYYMTVEANSCLSTPSSQETLTVYNKPVATVSFTDTLVCEGEQITLGAANQSGADYFWTGPNGYTANIQFPDTETLDPVDGGFYYVTLNRDACFSDPDSILITVKPRPDAPDIQTNTPICAEEELLLTTTVNGMDLYEWESPQGVLHPTTGPSFSVASASLLEQGNWRLRVTSNDCVSAYSVPIGAVVHPKPVPNAQINPNPACQGDDVTLVASSDVAGSSFSWTGPNDYNSAVQMPTLANISPARAGTYQVVVTTSAGCKDSTDLELEVFDDISIAGLSDNVPACIEEGFDILISSSTMPADDGSLTYSWSFGGAEISTDPNLSIPNASPADDGTYILEVFTADGCSSGQEAITIDLNFVPAQPNIPTSVSGLYSFCEGENINLFTSAISGANVEYHWSTPAGTIVTFTNTLFISDVDAGNDGNYSVRAIREGCPSSQSPTRVINIHPIPQLSISSNSPVCADDFISLQTTLYMNGDYNWTGPSGFTADVFNPIIENADSVMHSGTYNVSVNNLGCESDTVSVDVIVRNRPATPLISHDAPICLDNPQAVLTLSIDTASAVSGADYTWFANNGITPLDDASPDLFYELIDFDQFEEGGAFAFFARAELDGCFSALSSPTIVQFDTIPVNLAFAGRDTTVCSGDYVLQAQMPTVGTGMWTINSPDDPTGFMIANPDDANSIVSGLDSDIAPYNLSWTLSNGACHDYSVDSLEINVIDAEVAMVGDDILVCEDEIVTLNAVATSGDATGYWTQDITQRALGVGIVDSINPSTEITGLVSNNVYFFTWVVESVCGTTSAQIIANVSDPNLSGGADIIVCDETNEVSLAGSIPSTGSTAHWYSPDNDLEIVDNSSPTALVRNLKVGENILIWEADDGFCGEASRDTVSVFYKLPAQLQDDIVSIAFGGSTNVTPFDNDEVPAGSSITIQTAPEKGVATIVDASTINYVTPPNFVGEETLIYNTVSEGCPTVSATITFLIGEDAACKVPSLFTPNGDDYNDNFVIPCLLNTSSYPNSQVIIFNKWGDEVYRSNTPYLNDWGGTYSGEDLPADTYFFIVDLGNGDEPMSGHVTIIR